MTKPKQHHYVHSSYLSNFGDPKRLQVFDKLNDGRLFAASADKILRESGYFTQPVHAERRFDNRIETLFSGLESKWPKIVELIGRKKVLSTELYSHFIEVVSMMHSRVPNTRKAIEFCLQDRVKKSADNYDDRIPVEVVEYFISAYPSLAKIAANSQVTMRDLIAAGAINITIDPHRSISLIPQIVQRMMPYIGRLFQRSFLHNGTSLDFITSDNPIMYFTRGKGKEFASLVPFAQDAELHFEFLFPISRRIVFYHNTRENVTNVHRQLWSINTVRQINKLTALFADRFVVGSDPSLLQPARDYVECCPVPLPEKSLVLPDRIVKLRYGLGRPIRMPNWKTKFEDKQ